MFALIMECLNWSASEVVTKYSRNLVLLMQTGHERSSKSSSEKM